MEVRPFPIPRFLDRHSALELRSGRTLRGMQSTTPSGDAHRPVPAIRQRDPPSFSGSDAEDVNEWIDTYDRVSKHNIWDDATKLSNVSFYLTDLAKTWFLNHESLLTTWTLFREKAQELFGRSAYRKADAERKLSQRAQQPAESYTAYIQDVINLCARINPTMTEPEKLKHVLKGIGEDAFQLMVTKSPSTVEGALTLCRELQEAKNSRIYASANGRGFPVLPQCSHNDPVTSVAAIDQWSGRTYTVHPDSLRAIIREVVREELSRAQLQTRQVEPPSSSSSPTLQDIVRQEVAAFAPPNVLSPVCPSPTYADVLRMAPPAAPTPDNASTFAPMAAMYSAPPIGTPPPFRQYQRQADNRTCFYCGIKGHIARFCRKRRRDFAAASSFASMPMTSGYPSFAPPYQPRFTYRGDDVQGTPDDQAPYAQSRRRSVSPRVSRSPQRRFPRQRSPAPQENR